MKKYTLYFFECQPFFIQKVDNYIFVFIAID